MSVFVFLLCLQLASSLTVDTELKERYPFSVSLDETENYWLYWKVDYDAGVIFFAVQVNTPGWVGLGLSPNGKMPNSDIVTGWVKDGQAFLQDRFSTARSLPPIDSTQNVELVSASELNNITTLEFKRNIRACESNDRSIDIGTSRMIWAYNADDPDSPDTLKFHEQNMGWRSVNLLDGKETNDLSVPTGAMHVDLTMDKTYVPSSATTYWCKTFLLPKLESEAQIIGYDPVIEPGNEGLVHHMTVYECYNVTSFETGFDGVCRANMPQEAWRCYATVAVLGWAVGGRGERFPSDVGYPFGGKTGLHSVLIEMHYDNPKTMTGLVDSSGLRLYYTTIPRKYDATTVTVAYHSDPSLFLLRKQQAITVSTICPANCTKAGIPKEGVTVLYTLLHSHIAGRALTLRHFRNGKELPEILRNDNYDFNYQDTVAPAKEIKILPGDTLQIECTYTTESRSFNTFGGLGTNDEMCLATMTVYPAATLRNCLSRIPYSHFTSFINDSFVKGWAQYKGPLPSQIVDGLNTIDVSNPSVRKAYDEFLSTAERELFCNGKLDGFIPISAVVPFPQKFEPQPTEEPVPQCTGSGLGLQSVTLSGAHYLKAIPLMLLLFVFLCFETI